MRRNDYNSFDSNSSAGATAEVPSFGQMYRYYLINPSEMSSGLRYTFYTATGIALVAATLASGGLTIELSGTATTAAAGTVTTAAAGTATVDTVAGDGGHGGWHQDAIVTASGASLAKDHCDRLCLVQHRLEVWFANWCGGGWTGP